MNLTAEQLSSNWEKIINIIETEFTGDRKENLIKMYKAYEERLLYMPASSRDYYHSCYPGGYLSHVLNVIEFVQHLDEFWDVKMDSSKITKSYTREEMIFVALNHDFGKVGNETHEYYQTHNEKWKKERGELYKINENITYMNLIDRTFFILQEFNIQVTETEYLAIKLHGGMYDSGNETYLAGYSKAKQLQNELPILMHSADHMATRYEYALWSKKLNSTVIKKKVEKDTMVRRYTKHKMPSGLGDVASTFFGDPKK